MAIEPTTRYPGISAQGFAHPAERAATAAIRTVPGLDKVVKLLSEHSYERRLRQLLTETPSGSATTSSPASGPAEALRRRARRRTLPEALRDPGTGRSGLTIGTNEPVTLVSSGLVGSYTDDELTAVLGHEMGHVLADHVGLTTTLQLVQMILGGAIRAVPLAGVPLVALYLALLEWSRAAELTSDRASAIVTGEPLVACQALMRMAGGPVRGPRPRRLPPPGDRVRGGEGPLRPLLPVLRRDHDDPPVPGATGAGTRSPG